MDLEDNRYPKFGMHKENLLVLIFQLFESVRKLPAKGDRYQDSPDISELSAKHGAWRERLNSSTPSSRNQKSPSFKSPSGQCSALAKSLTVYTACPSPLVDFVSYLSKIQGLFPRNGRGFLTELRPCRKFGVITIDNSESLNYSSPDIIPNAVDLGEVESGGPIFPLSMTGGWVGRNFPSRE
jgi:hypothetical protein